MNQGQYAAVIGSLERIDRTGTAPEISGPIGRFLRAYAQHRLSVAKLSVDMGITPRKDGTLPGGALGIATLRLFDDAVTWDETTTEFGVLYHVPALCDEFLSPVTLRLWSTTAPGAEGIHSLVNLRLRAQGVRLQGDFLWKPPSVLVPNKAKFLLIDMPDYPHWLGADYLRYVGEDVGIDPHALSYIPLSTSRSRVFAALRIVAGVAEDRRTLIVPFATKEGLIKVTARIDAISTPAARSLILGRRPGLWLIAREPDDEDWIVLDASEATHGDLVRHAANWGAYLRSLNAEAAIPSGARIVEHTLANLRRIGLTDSPQVEPPAIQQSRSPLAVRIAEQMRFPNRRVGTKVLSG